MTAPLRQERGLGRTNAIGELPDMNQGVRLREKRLGHARAEPQPAVVPLEDGGLGLGSREREHVQPHASDVDDMIPEFGGFEALLLTELGQSMRPVRGPDVPRYEGDAIVAFGQWNFPRYRLAELCANIISQVYVQTRTRSSQLGLQLVLYV